MSQQQLELVRARAGAWPGGRAKTAAIVYLCVAEFLVVGGLPIVAVALPDLARELQISTASLQWVVSAYVLSFGGFLLLAGRLGDLYGNWRIVVVGLVAFGLGSLACALTASLMLIIIARGVQGFGAALVTPNTLAIITRTGSAAARSRAVGIWTAAQAAGAASGWVLGGALTQAFGWRSVFVAPIPIAVVLIALALWLLVNDARPRVRGSLDVGGAIAITVSVTLAIYGLTRLAERGANAAKPGLRSY